ncbi:MAG: type II toxin-antitoxin system RelE/ParE family toxin [Betaproteobacteria bacterium]|nr:type II toxin-antitoxin system RelE/ParE family toxin [Betaproteobacteria bacterium]
MARLIYSERALDDLERLTDFLIESDPRAAAETVGLVEEAVAVLARHPLIGRPVESGLRELVISRGQTGYVALYSFEQADDAVLILSVRHQREAGYYSED